MVEEFGVLWRLESKPAPGTPGLAPAILCQKPTLIFDLRPPKKVNTQEEL